MPSNEFQNPVINQVVEKKERVVETETIFFLIPFALLLNKKEVLKGKE